MTDDEFEAEETTPDTIQPGSGVTMHFSLSLEDGTVADSTEGDEPLEFVMGDGTLIESLELMLYGLRAGAHQRLAIEPRDAFGYPDPENIHSMPRAEFDEDMLAEGNIISFSTPSGEEVPGAIREVRDEEVVVDFNHPLAGHTVTFAVEILEVSPPKPHH
ncbi:MAG: FKBP-type peptidyl-prolyl cis-trans isomerase [Pseudomonadota bacterium]|nr:MAG: FKBP-type peptidyl-prolyl cis-trans isomerase [Pseudomonadota bacterium]